MATRNQIDASSANLTAEQMRPLVNELVYLAIVAEDVNFGDLAPYWAHDGEPLIDGQETHSGDE